jgi:transposase, IS5 family
MVEVRRINSELAAIAQRAVPQAERVVRNARRKQRTSDSPPGRARSEINRLETLAVRTAKIAEQCRQRLDGTTPNGATRVVSPHDADARPIVEGRLGRPVEFGYKAQLVDNEDVIIVDHNVAQGNPPDAPDVVPAIARVRQRTGRAPRAVTADRGYGDRDIEHQLRDLGVALPGNPDQGQTQPRANPTPPVD